jgi:hypothetical protein
VSPYTPRSACAEGDRRRGTPGARSYCAGSSHQDGRQDRIPREHILAWNDENRARFDNDEERFEQERNRLGGILLLKGKDNISSNNESYQDKLKSYANTLYWNETLRADSYKSKLDMTALKARHGLDLQPLDEFGPDDLEARHKLLFKLVGIIWA